MSSSRAGSCAKREGVAGQVSDAEEIPQGSVTGDAVADLTACEQHVVLSVADIEAKSGRLFPFDIDGSRRLSYSGQSVLEVQSLGRTGNECPDVDG